MATTRRRKHNVSRPDFAAQTPEPATAAGEDILDFEDAETLEAGDLPLRTADLPPPLTVNRAALNDEMPDSPAAAAQVQPEPQSEDFDALLNRLAGENISADETFTEVDEDDHQDTAITEAVTEETVVEEADEIEETMFLDEEEEILETEEEIVLLDDEATSEVESVVVLTNEPSLDDNADFWANLDATPDDDDVPAPSLGTPAAAEEQVQSPLEVVPPLEAVRTSLLRRRPKPVAIDADLVERARAHREIPALAVEADEGVDEAVPLAVDEEEAVKEWQPRVHVASRQGVFAGPSALSLIATNVTPDGDEMNHALAAFAELDPGQKGFIRISLRAYPEFKAESRAWLAATKIGQDPHAKRKAHHVGGAWLKYFFAWVWFEANKANPHALGGRVPPQSPGQRGNVKPLTASEAGAEKAQAWKDAERKALSTPHYEVALRVGIVGRNEDKEQLERVVEEVTAGFDAYASVHQELVWAPADPYDTTIGCMGLKRPSVVTLALSADEMGELARVPDDMTRPHGVQMRRSYFKQMALPNPLVIENPYEPEPGLIPLGIMNPRSEDQQYFGMRVDELDKHMYYVGATGTGKALDVDTPIPTPDGWRRMGDLRTGDTVFDEDGRPTVITQAFNVQHERPVFELVFSDGSTIVADEEHKWLTWTRAARTQNPRVERSLKSWVAAVVRAYNRDKAANCLDERVHAGQMHRELAEVPRGELFAALSGIEGRHLDQVEELHHYEHQLVIKHCRRYIATRGDLYRALMDAAYHRRQGRPDCEAAVVTTKEIRASLRTKSGHLNHSIELVSGPLQYNRKEQPIPPYLLGAWLGDGSSYTARITTADPEIRAEVEALGYPIRVTTNNGTEAIDIHISGGVNTALRGLGVLKNKHIPEIYLQGDEDQRWALLQGLLDTDGGVDRGGACEFYNTNRKLATQVVELAAGLGMQPRLRERRAQSGGPAYTVSFMAPRPAFRLPRKALLQKMTRSDRARRRYIVDVKPVPTRPVRCIAVDSPTHLYLAGKNCVPTHNSELMKWLVFGVAKAGYPLVVIDPHGALGDDLLNMLVVNCPERIGDILMCDLADGDWPVALNPLDIHAREEIEPTVHSIMEMLAKQMNLGQSAAPRAVNLASQALSALCEANLNIKDPDTKCTLLHVVSFFIDVEFRRLVMEFCTNVSVRETFDAENGPFETLTEKQQSEFAMPIIRAFQPLGSSDSFSAVFSAGENRLDFGQLITDRKIVLVKLAHFSYQKKLGEFVGSLILPWLLSSMDSWGRYRDAVTGESLGGGCRVFVDEAPTLIGPGSSAIELLAGARKYDLGLITTSQYPSQFDRSVLDALLANTNSKISLKLDPSEARPLANSIAGVAGNVTAGDIADLPNFHYYANIMLPTAEGAANSGAFSAACLPPINCTLSDEHKQLRELVKKRSRDLICNRKDDISERRLLILGHIKGALGQALIDREDSEAPVGGDYAIPLDPLDDRRTFSGW